MSHVILNVKMKFLTSSKIGNFKEKISFVEQNDEFYLDTPFDELKMEYLKFEDEINEDEIDEYLNIFEISHLKYKKFKKMGKKYLVVVKKKIIHY